MPGGNRFFCSSENGTLSTLSPKHTMKAGMLASSNTSIWSLPMSTATSGRADANTRAISAMARWQAS